MLGPEMAYIGRRSILNFDNRGKIIGNTISRRSQDRLLIDLSKKEHSLILGRIGSGKSYLTGVLAEEYIENNSGHAVLLIDMMGVFGTLGIPNSTDEIELWNRQTGIPDIRPRAYNENIMRWVPRGDAEKFIAQSYDRVFSFKPRDISPSTLCFAFNLDILDQQTNLYRKARRSLLQENEDYTLNDLRRRIEDIGESYYKPSTIEALLSRVDALDELGIIDEEGISLPEMLRPHQIVILDLSQSSIFTARVLVNLIAEQALMLRKKVMKLIQTLRGHERIPRPEYYIPPVQMLIDEAHNFLPGSLMLTKCIKEGRNSGVMVTAVSQSPDLSREIYANISHLFIGPLTFDYDIDYIKKILPIEKTPSSFRKLLKTLTIGNFVYYNMVDKTEMIIRVRPRKSLHPASTRLIDEEKLFL